MVLSDKELKECSCTGITKKISIGGKIKKNPMNIKAGAKMLFRNLIIRGDYYTPARIRMEACRGTDCGIFVL